MPTRVLFEAVVARGAVALLPRTRIDRPLDTFSGGWLMRVELAKLLLSKPDVLLLDEPTNHLDLPSIQWFEETLLEYPGAVVIISHDRTFLRRHVNRVAELAGGELTVFDGSFDRYIEQKELRREEILANQRLSELREDTRGFLRELLADRRATLSVDESVSARRVAKPTDIQGGVPDDEQ